MAKTVSVAHMEAHLSDCIQAAEEGDTVVITRNGQPVVALVKVAEPERLRAEGSQEGLASLAGGWEGSEELVQRVAESLRTPPRTVEDLD